MHQAQVELALISIHFYKGNNITIFRAIDGRHVVSG